MKKLHRPQSLFVVFFFLLSGLSMAQTFTSNESDSLGIGTDWKTFPLLVENLPAPLGSTFGIENVCFSINHPNVIEVEIRLRSPWGQIIHLVEGLPIMGQNFDNTQLGDYYNAPMAFNFPPYSGTYRSFQNIAHLNKGNLGNGEWQLEVRDKSSGLNRGFLESWCLKFSNQPARVFPFEKSKLPVLVISTNNQIIEDDPKISGYLQIISRPVGELNPLADTLILPKIPLGIELRGSSSQMFPKKSYGFEIRDHLGEDSSASLLGMPAESDWALIANFSDKTFMRNALTYEMARKMGQYAPRTHYVEVVVNGDYQGLYVLTEKIKRATDRVNISKLKKTDTTGSGVTGGYILKIDKETGSVVESFDSQYLPNSSDLGQIIRFQIDYPKPENLHPKQKIYIQDYMHQFESALIDSNFQDPELGYRKFIDVPSFIDFFLLNEWSRNVDAYRISTFLHKPKSTSGGGKLKAGPVWDFDIAYYNANYCDATQTSGWAYDFPLYCPDDLGQPPFWWERLREDPNFNRELGCRWKEVNTTIFNPMVGDWIDSVRTLIFDAQARNFQLWNIMGMTVWPNPEPPTQSFDDEILRLKSWMFVRKLWMDNQLNPSCTLTEIANAAESNQTICPNPTTGAFRLTGFEPGLTLKLTNILGVQVQSFVSGNSEYSISNLPAGMYFLQSENSKHPSLRLVKQ